MTSGTEGDPKLVNMVEPLAQITLHTPAGPVQVNMQLFTEAVEAQGLHIGKFDVCSIGLIRNAKNEWVPNYDTIRIERVAPPIEDVDE